MASYIVMEPPEGDREAVLVRDGFQILAFLLPVLWFLFHRLWFEAVIALAVAVALAIAGSFAGFGGAPALSLLVSIYVGLEGAALRVAALRRRGWREWGVVEADSAVDAEMRFFAEATAGHPAVQTRQQTSFAPAPARSPRGPALGLFSYPGRG